MILTFNLQFLYISFTFPQNSAPCAHLGQINYRPASDERTGAGTAKG